MKLLDYIRGFRKGKEAHRLEKESMSDPFLADAMDGYRQVEGNHEQQIRKLRAQVTKYSAKKKNSYAIIWSIAACLVIGIGISSYFLFLKEKASPLTVHIPDSDSVHATTKNQTDKKDIVAKAKQISKPRILPKTVTPATVIPVKEKDSISEEVTEVITTEDTLDRKKKEITRLSAQTSLIKGKVTDEKGEPLAGATIVYKGTDIGTVTNLEGEFSLIKKKNDEDLTVSYLGYNRIDMPIDTSETMLIAMNESPTQKLDEVVIIGFGSQKKSSIIGAISTVPPESLNTSPDTTKFSLTPEPVIGMKKYQKYLKKKLIRPTDETCNQVKGKVVLTFLVDQRARPFGIMIKKGLCESADKEAIRLIQEGPDWTLGKKPVEITVEF